MLYISKKAEKDLWLPRNMKLFFKSSFSIDVKNSKKLHLQSYSPIEFFLVKNSQL